MLKENIYFEFNGGDAIITLERSKPVKLEYWNDNGEAVVIDWRKPYAESGFIERQARDAAEAAIEKADAEREAEQRDAEIGEREYADLLAEQNSNYYRAVMGRGY